MPASARKTAETAEFRVDVGISPYMFCVSGYCNSVLLQALLNV